LTDHWRCRYKSAETAGESPIEHSDIVALLNHIQAAGLDFIKTENLYAFDGVKGYSAGQGE
jgi:isocitrate dehydrogenase